MEFFLFIRKILEQHGYLFDKFLNNDIKIKKSHIFSRL